MSWGPNTYSETDTTTSPTSVIVKQIAIDGTQLASGVNALSFIWSSGQVQFGDSNIANSGGLNIVVSPSNDPIHNFDGTILWVSSASPGGLGNTWVDLLSLSGNHTFPKFTNPNPAGTFYVTFTGAVGLGSVSPQGFRNFTLAITTTASIVGVGASAVHDNRTLDVTFSVVPNFQDATNVSNYSVNNGLVVTRSVRMADKWYRLTTTRQVQGVTYTITATNIKGP